MTVFYITLVKLLLCLRLIIANIGYFIYWVFLTTCVIFALHLTDFSISVFGYDAVFLVILKHVQIHLALKRLIVWAFFVLIKKTCQQIIQ